MKLPPLPTCNYGRDTFMDNDDVTKSDLQFAVDGSV